jgi:hypothetical protein
VPAYQNEILWTVLTDNVAHGDVIRQPNLLPDADEFSTTEKKTTQTLQHVRVYIHGQTDKRRITAV